MSAITPATTWEEHLENVGLVEENVTKERASKHRALRDFRNQPVVVDYEMMREHGLYGLGTCSAGALPADTAGPAARALFVLSSGGDRYQPKGIPTEPPPLRRSAWRPDPKPVASGATPAYPYR